MQNNPLTLDKFDFVSINFENMKNKLLNYTKLRIHTHHPLNNHFIKLSDFFIKFLNKNYNIFAYQLITLIFSI